MMRELGTRLDTPFMPSELRYYGLFPQVKKSYSIQISAQSLMGNWMEFSYVDWDEIDNYSPITTWYSANSIVTLTIKSGKIRSFNAQTENVDGTVTTTFYTKDYTPSWVTNEYDYYAAPTLIVKATTKNGAPINYAVDWGDNYSSYAYSHASGEEYSFSHKYYPGPVGTTRYYTITVTAYTDEYYGGWSKTQTIEITVHNNGKMSGGGGGGACPFLFTYNGTWKAENNMLVWAENATRQFLSTEDYYLFNGKEINGKIKIGLGEFGEDVDYIDAVKLYKVVAPHGYKLVEGYNGKVYAYKQVEIPSIIKDDDGNNVKSKIEKEDGNYWIGEKGDYVDVLVNLSKKNLILIRGIDNPPIGSNITPNWHRPPATMSTIWIYANVSGEWIKLSEIKVRHNMHTNAINLNNLIHRTHGTIELRFEMRDRNGLDFIGMVHDFKKAKLKSVKIIDATKGLENLRYRDGEYLKINPGDFIAMSFKGRGNGAYLLKVYGFYFNRDKIGKGIGIVRENETNIAEAELIKNITSGNYVLLPLLSNYSDIMWMEWYVDGWYVYGEKPVVYLNDDTHYVELYVWREDGTEEYYCLFLT